MKALAEYPAEENVVRVIVIKDPLKDVMLHFGGVGVVVGGQEKVKVGDVIASHHEAGQAITDILTTTVDLFAEYGVEQPNEMSPLVSEAFTNPQFLRSRQEVFVKSVEAQRRHPLPTATR